MRRLRTIQLAVVLGLATVGPSLGCANAAPRGAAVAPRPQGFRCVGRDHTVPMAARPVANVPAGRLDVRRLAGPADPAQTSWRDMRVAVTAAGAPMSAFATALADALSMGVVLDDRLVGVRVSMNVPEIEVGRLLETLRDLYDVVPLSEGANRVLIVSRERVAEPGLRPRLPGEPPPEVPPLETRLVPLPSSLSAVDVAATFCHHAASARGSASVAGHAVIVTDVSERLERLERLLAELRGR